MTMARAFFELALIFWGLVEIIVLAFVAPWETAIEVSQEHTLALEYQSTLGQQWILKVALPENRFIMDSLKKEPISSCGVAPEE